MMIPGAFDYHAPQTVDEAIALLVQHGDDAKILAGGQSLIPAMRFRLASPTLLIDINKLAELEYVREENGHLAIGALTREMMLEDSASLRQTHPLLADAARVIADPLVRNRATVGGNLAHADPANDHPAVMLAYGAEVVARGPNGTRVIPIDDLFVGLFETSLHHDELLIEIRIPRPPASSSGASIKNERKVGDYAVSAVALNAEQALIGRQLSEEVLEAAGRAAAAECDPSADLRGSVEYKRDLTRVLAKRAIRKAAERASV
jgi:aerobic carbon-monoxide dehydrogenase medium subunit